MAGTPKRGDEFRCGYCQFKLASGDMMCWPIGRMGAYGSAWAQEVSSGQRDKHPEAKVRETSITELYGVGMSPVR